MKKSEVVEMLQGIIQFIGDSDSEVVEYIKSIIESLCPPDKKK